jgi:chromosomal replication initiator protein
MDHRLTADNTFFRPSAHLFSRRSQPSPEELINTLERALRDVAALPHNLSPVVVLAHQALADVQRLNASDRLATISAYVAYQLGVSYEQLLSKSRTQHVAFCRQVAMYVCRRVTHASFPVLGEHFQRNHSSVHHAFKLIDQRVHADGPLRRAIESIERDLNHIWEITAASA